MRRCSEKKGLNHTADQDRITRSISPQRWRASQSFVCVRGLYVAYPLQDFCRKSFTIGVLLYQLLGDSAIDGRCAPARKCNTLYSKENKSMASLGLIILWPAGVIGAVLSNRIMQSTHLLPGLQVVLQCLLTLPAPNWNNVCLSDNNLTKSID